MKYKRKSDLRVEPELNVFVFIDKYPFKAVDNVITMGDEEQHNIEVGIEPVKLSIKYGKKYFQAGILLGTLDLHIGSRIN